MIISVQHKHIITLIMILFTNLILLAQSIPFNHINTLDGLSNNNVNDSVVVATNSRKTTPNKQQANELKSSIKKKLEQRMENK